MSNNNWTSAQTRMFKVIQLFYNNKKTKQKNPQSPTIEKWLNISIPITLKHHIVIKRLSRRVLLSTM